uniref:Calcium binding n=1 Tax=Candidatus Kentrum sp. FM TaxID=2126340 RepID=A0A450THZ4_9GAMM|nr:MAG: Calcium binding [Candidatus Kentron sp. FM]VFJ66862.1 MAG: Calcium binding [Candidatus Kentron sp. FM]VFK21439.1 MAG: Calcium binding [Candidatus Kentron sp. FM]
MTLEIGDSVLVKKNIKDPELGSDMGGWQGRISEIDDEDIVCVSWDSITLSRMPASMIKKCEQEGFDWDRYYLHKSDLESATPRDTNKDVDAVIRKLESEYGWFYLGEEGERVQSVLFGISPSDEWACFSAWDRYLKKKLLFPFKAIIDEPQDRGPLDTGDKVIVHGIGRIADPYGILVDLQHKKRNYRFPLADLEIIDKDSGNYQPVRDYVVWFANR